MVFTPEAFRLIQVGIDNIEVDARPVEWNEEDYDGTGHNRDGETIIPTAYMTTCPHCSQGIRFTVEDIIVIQTMYHVICPECNAGHIEQHDKHEKSYVVYEEIPFIDPIEAGMLIIDRMIDD